MQFPLRQWFIDTFYLGLIITFWKYTNIPRIDLLWDIIRTGTYQVPAPWTYSAIQEFFTFYILFLLLVFILVSFFGKYLTPAKVRV